MREAQIDGKLVIANKDAPDEATCPSCGSPVRKRKRKCLDGTVTWFWRHVRDAGDGCPHRYRPVS